VNANEFRDYIAEGPRDYDTILLFTSSSEELKCSPCSALNQELSQVAEWYNSKRSHHLRELFFVSLDHAKAKEIFIKYAKKISLVPSFIILEKTKKTGSQFKWNPGNVWQHTGSTDAQSIARWINSKFNNDNLIPPVETNVVPYYVLIAMVIISVGRSIYLHYQSPFFWTVLAMIAPWFSYTGTIWNFNRGPPLIGITKESWFLIYPGMRMQTILEGLLMSCVLIGLSLLVCGLLVYVPKLAEGRDQEEFRQTFYQITLSFVTLFCMLIAMFLRKSPGYLRYF